MSACKISLFIKSNKINSVKLLHANLVKFDRAYNEQFYFTSYLAEKSYLIFVFFRFVLFVCFFF